MDQETTRRVKPLNPDDAFTTRVKPPSSDTPPTRGRKPAGKSSASKPVFDRADALDKLGKGLVGIGLAIGQPPMSLETTGLAIIAQSEEVAEAALDLVEGNARIMGWIDKLGSGKNAYVLARFAAVVFMAVQIDRKQVAPNNLISSIPIAKTVQGEKMTLLDIYHQTPQYQRTQQSSGTPNPNVMHNANFSPPQDYKPAR